MSFTIHFHEYFLIGGCGLLVGVVCVFFSGNGRFCTREGMRNRKFIWSSLRCIPD